MTTEEAFTILERVWDQVSAQRAVHEQIGLAFVTLRAAVAERDGTDPPS